MKRVLGWIVLLSPFVGIFIFGLIKIGLLNILSAFAISALIVFIVWLGIYLISDKN